MKPTNKKLKSMYYRLKKNSEYQKLSKQFRDFVNEWIKEETEERLNNEQYRQK